MVNTCYEQSAILLQETAYIWLHEEKIFAILLYIRHDNNVLQRHVQLCRTLLRISRYSLQLELAFKSHKIYFTA